VAVLRAGISIGGRDMETFPHLFEPIRLGEVTVRNRIVSTAHMTFFVSNNLPTDRLREYYRARARGGTGLIVIEPVSVHPSNVASGHLLKAHDDSAIPWLKSLGDAIHEFGATAMIELTHGGANGMYTIEAVVGAPSAVPIENARYMPRELETSEIQSIVRGFAQAATFAKKASLDGVILHGGNGNLIQQFLSPFSNRREDIYGGSAENRLRFVSEVLCAVREAVGEEFPIGLRIPGDEFLSGGLTLDDTKWIAQRLQTGLDFLDINCGNYSSYVGWSLGVAPMSVPLGPTVYLASAIRESVRIPVITVGRINDPVQAEQIIADGHADMVGMTRALVCDPDLPEKARQGRIEEIRTCVACCAGCVGREERGQAMGCIQNPITGHEAEWTTIQPAQQPASVMVVGGGPGGMEAAWAASLRGHKVTLYEKADALGGQIPIAALAPNRDEFGDVVRNLTQQLKGTNVCVRLGVDVSSRDVLAESPEAVILATGSVPYVPAVPGIENPNVVTDWDILTSKVAASELCVVLDGDASERSCSVAEFLLAKGKQVVLATRAYHVGINLNKRDKPLTLLRLLDRGLISYAHTWIKEVRPGEVVLEDTLSGIETVFKDATLVLAIGGKANDHLYRELVALEGLHSRILRVGDCLAPRTAEHAIYEGFKAGISI